MRQWQERGRAREKSETASTPTLVVHNIDGRVPGIFGKGITEVEPGMALDTLRSSAFSAFLIGQHAARLMLGNKPNANGAKGTIIFTNASAALEGFPKSGAFAMACQAKAGLAQSMARELMPRHSSNCTKSDSASPRPLTS
jgi:NAD(P)-dependent dehydrogenase (short-subunit alcohol dehydrogenase family)